MSTVPYPSTELQSIAPIAAIYRTRLKRAGIPHRIAQICANAIVRWDKQRVPANPLQVPLLVEYQGQIELAGLWSPGALLSSAKQTT